MITSWERERDGWLAGRGKKKESGEEEGVRGGGAIGVSETVHIDARGGGG